MTGNIRDQIVQLRRRRIEREGHELGHFVPARRQTPVAPFGRDPFLICEIKRRSPSRGDIAASLDPVVQARSYVDCGIRSISVLTEEDHFSGSLADLMAVKKEFPDVSVLRKDFLIDEEDLLVSYRAGADAVLLIASLFDAKEFGRLYGRACDLGLAVLVEVHDEEDVETVRGTRPVLLGINSRNLKTFAVDKLHPVLLRRSVDWPARVVFESGIRHPEDVSFARATGFAGVLVGESVTRDPGLIPSLSAGFQSTPRLDRFWSRLQRHGAGGEARPLVKVCGICRETDGRLAADLGADILGFVFAESPRRTTEETVRALADVDLPKVAVVVTGDGSGLPADAARLLESGYLDAVQFHGDEEPDECFNLAFPYYKALRLKDSASAAAMSRYRCPRVLVDAFTPGVRGGSGARISPPLLKEAKAHGPLWLAGGLRSETIRMTIAEYSPQLVDAASGLERRPGEKDALKMRQFFQEIHYAHG